MRMDDREKAKRVSQIFKSVCGEIQDGERIRFKELVPYKGAVQIDVFHDDWKGFSLVIEVMPELSAAIAIARNRSGDQQLEWFKCATQKLLEATMTYQRGLCGLGVKCEPVRVRFDHPAHCDMHG